MYLLAPFILQKFKNILRADPNGPLSGIFFGTNYYYYFHQPTGPFHCAKVLKIITVDPQFLRMYNFWA